MLKTELEAPHIAAASTTHTLDGAQREQQRHFRPVLEHCLEGVCYGKHTKANEADSKAPSNEADGHCNLQAEGRAKLGPFWEGLRSHHAYHFFLCISILPRAAACACAVGIRAEERFALKGSFSFWYLHVPTAAQQQLAHTATSLCMIRLPPLPTSPQMPGLGGASPAQQTQRGQRHSRRAGSQVPPSARAW